MKKIKTWEDVLGQVDSEDLDTAIQFAQLCKVEIPADILAEKAKKDALSNIQVVYGSKNDPTRAYLQAPGTDIAASGGGRDGTKAKQAQGVRPEVRSLDETIAFLTAARDALRQAGFNTSQAETVGCGMTAARDAGFKVSVAKDVDPAEVFQG